MLNLFLAAAAALQPAAAPAPLMIFFDSGGKDIRREWEPVLDEAAKAAAGVTRLRIIGHSDRPGSPAVNRRFALQRAQVVADALVARGVQRSVLLIETQGEDSPFIPTPDNVREIQNRRVDIRPE
ncbi:OmpA family protein [Sphingomonas glaciei]|uniref:OmpA family protein n=1 Tax=Sphingomonas glaciei TaxID=2938948 RepID=A0ABY5MX28_9SPHN|nr:OmpA family protein [Sphingomonas glaciei]UUR09012.1 OmpA family protein [Sphingomonas glaciei]